MPPEGGERAPTLVRRPGASGDDMPSRTELGPAAVTSPGILHPSSHRCRGGASPASPRRRGWRTLTRRPRRSGGRMPRRARPSCPRSSPAGPGPSPSCRRVRAPCGRCASRAPRAATAGFRRRTEAHRPAGSLRLAARNFPAAVPGRRSVVPSRAGIPSRHRGQASRRVVGGAASCRVLGSRCPVASWGVGVLSLGSGATSRSAARAGHDSGGVTSGACGVATARPSLSRVSSPVGCRRSCRSLQRTSDTENDTDGDSDSGDSGRGGAVGRDGARLLPRTRSRASPQRG